MQKIKILISDSHDPWFNLATEDYIFRDMDPSYQILFLWRNTDTVVIGRYQNPFKECNLRQMEKEGVKLTRRQSGGGAVFQDLGNTNFTFLSSNENYDKEINNKIIIDALKKFSITAYASGRNDILVDHRKISGSAFKQTKDRSFHHGTLLIGANLSKLQNYLNPNPKKLQSKGIASVKSRVANLSEFHPELNHENLCAEIMAQFKKQYISDCEVEHLDPARLEKLPELRNYYEKMKDWNWRFGETPEFNHELEERFNWGGMNVHIDSHKGKITDIKIFSDSLHPEMIDLLMNHLKGVDYSIEGIEDGVSKVQNELPMIKDYLEEFKTWLCLSL